MRDRQDDTGTPHRNVVRAPLVTGAEPPDVIDVVFPEVGPPAAPAPSATGAADPSPSGSRHRASNVASRAWPERPLLWGGLAIGAAGLAILLVWVVRPQSQAGGAAYRPVPVPTAPVATLPLPHTGPPLKKRPSTGATAPRPTAAEPSRPYDAPPPAILTPPRPATAGHSTPASPPTTGPRTLHSGDTGPDVRELQHLLFDQGFTYVSMTGVYDAATVRGVTQLQQDRGLTCDPRGVYGPCTRAALTA